MGKNEAEKKFIYHRVIKKNSIQEEYHNWQKSFKVQVKSKTVIKILTTVKKFKINIPLYTYPIKNIKNIFRTELKGY